MPKQEIRQQLITPNVLLILASAIEVALEWVEAPTSVKRKARTRLEFMREIGFPHSQFAQELRQMFLNVEVTPDNLNHAAGVSLFFQSVKVLEEISRKDPTEKILESLDGVRTLALMHRAYEITRKFITLHVVRVDNGHESMDLTLAPGSSNVDPELLLPGGPHASEKRLLLAFVPTEFADLVTATESIARLYQHLNALQESLGGEGLRLEDFFSLSPIDAPVGVS